MEGHQVVLACAQIAVGIVAGWLFRRNFESEPGVCTCGCACHCACELGLSTGLGVLLVLILVIVGGLGYIWFGRHQRDTHRFSTIGGKGKGAFGSVGKLPLTT